MLKVCSREIEWSDFRNLMLTGSYGRYCHTEKALRMICNDLENNRSGNISRGCVSRPRVSGTCQTFNENVAV